MAKDSAAGRRNLEAQLEQRRELEARKENPDWRQIRRGWCWGPESFRDQMLDWIDRKKGGQHYGEELRESDEQKAHRLASEMLRRAGWGEEELKRRRKSDAAKVRIASRLRAETTMTWAWISARLVMGHWRTARNAVLSAPAAK